MSKGPTHGNAAAAASALARDGSVSDYLALLKPRVMSLVVFTAFAGLYLAPGTINPVIAATAILCLAGGAGASGAINMWYDRDIDSKMKRTQNRPLAAGEVSPSEALRLGLVLSSIGVAWAVAMDPLYGLIVFAGLFFDVVVYTIWLKRRTAWSIIWGGISGGMPILAGRVLGTGSIDWIGVVLSLSILFWIPTHIMTFSMKYHEDYVAAGIPTFPSTYGFAATRAIVALSSVIAALAIGLAAYGIGLTWGYLRVLFVLSVGLLSLAVGSLLKPSERVNFGLFKYASLYMLSSMFLLMINVL